MGQQEHDRFHQLMGVVLDWNIVQRMALLAFLILLETLQYAIWALVVYVWPYAHAFIDVQVLARTLPISLSLPVVSALLYGCCRYYSQRPHARIVLPLQYVLSLYYSLAMTYFGYLVGSMSISSGVVLMGAPVFGILMLERRPVYVALLMGLSTTIVVSWLSQIHAIPYAPLLKASDAAGLAGSDFWMWSMFFFLLPHVLIVVLIADALVASLRRREADVRYLSERDGLTGLLNRRSLHLAFETVLARAQAGQRHIAVLLLDLDHFKLINDTHGHLAGDEVLVHTANILRQATREQDVLGRFGGEEFMLVLADTTPLEVSAIAERIRTLLQALQLHDVAGCPIVVRGSIGGVCEVARAGLGFHQLVAKADHALYQAKQQGRNQVMMSA